MDKTKPSTVGRGKSLDRVFRKKQKKEWKDDYAHLHLGDSLNHYKKWDTPTTIISDGGYGILGFEGDTPNHHKLPNWYEPHIEEWSKFSTPQTTLWLWNSEIGWAAIHPILEKHGWKYINCNVWNKGKGHIAGNINTKTIKRFPVVSEVCVQYVLEAKINDMNLRDWLRFEWKRTGLAFKKANEACGVKDAATRKYLDKGHLWYSPPPATFEKLVNYANKFGDKSKKPYFSLDGKNPMSADDWLKMKAKFYCPHGYTNIWDRGSLRGKERIKVDSKSKSAHLNQKPIDLLKLIIEASTEENDVVWEPFGGLFSASYAAKLLKRKAFSCEIDEDYFAVGVNRFRNRGSVI